MSKEFEKQNSDIEKDSYSEPAKRQTETVTYQSLSFGKKVRLYRIVTGITQTNLSKEIGWRHQACITSLEKDLSTPLSQTQMGRLSALVSSQEDKYQQIHHLDDLLKIDSRSARKKYLKDMYIKLSGKNMPKDQIAAFLNIDIEELSKITKQSKKTIHSKARRSNFTIAKGLESKIVNLYNKNNSIEKRGRKPETRKKLSEETVSQIKDLRLQGKSTSEIVNTVGLNTYFISKTINNLISKGELPESLKRVSPPGKTGVRLLNALLDFQEKNPGKTVKLNQLLRIYKIDVTREYARVLYILLEKRGYSLPKRSTVTKIDKDEKEKYKLKILNLLTNGKTIEEIAKNTKLSKNYVEFTIYQLKKEGRFEGKVETSRTKKRKHLKKQILILVLEGKKSKDIAKELKITIPIFWHIVRSLRDENLIKPTRIRRKPEMLEAEDEKVRQLRNKGFTNPQIANELNIHIYRVNTSVKRLLRKGLTTSKSTKTTQ